MCSRPKLRPLGALLVSGALIHCIGQTAEPAPPSSDELRYAPAANALPTGTATASASSAPPSSTATSATTVVPTPNTSPSAMASASAPVTYHKDIRAIFEQSCVECHGGKPEDRIAPFSLDTWETVSTAVMSWDIAGAIESGRMPPWMPADGCRQLADTRALDSELRARVVQWRDAGYPQGDPAEYVAPAIQRAASLGEPTLVLSVATAYTPKIDDEYTCFGLADDKGAPYSVPDERYLVAIQVLPGEPSEVHHVQVHRTDAAGSAGPTNCSGFVGGSAENMFSWRPGSTPLRFPQNAAARISAGNGFTVQIHYNAAFAVEGKQPDRTRVAFWFMPEGRPQSLITRIPVFGPVNIPAGAQEVISNGRETLDGASEIVGITPHAHMLATKMSAQVNVGGKDECLIEIPKWDFHWQDDYLFQEPIATMGGASITTTCVWNNSAANQPVVNMQPLQPRNITFGEGSFDEMCLHYIWLRSPFR